MKHTGYTYLIEAKVTFSLGDLTLFRYLAHFLHEVTYHLPGPDSFLWGWTVRCCHPTPGETVTLEEVREAYYLEGDDYIEVEDYATGKQLDKLCKLMEASVHLKGTDLEAKAHLLTKCLYGTLRHMQGAQLPDMDFPGGRP